MIIDYNVENFNFSCQRGLYNRLNEKNIYFKKILKLLKMAKIKPTEKNTLIKHSAVVHISNNLTATERKVSNILLKNAFPNLSKTIKHSIYIRDILNELGHSEDSFKNYSFIEEAVKKLVSTSVTFNILSKDKKKKWAGTIALLAEAFPRGGLIEYSYPSSLVDVLAKPNIYTTLDLNYQKELKSKYSLAIWEFCNEQLDTAKVEQITTSYIPLDKVKDLLGATEKIYDEFKTLNSKVIKPAISEVNENTDINVKVMFYKVSRKVVSMAFSISRFDIKPIQKTLFEDNIDPIMLLEQRAMENEIMDIGLKLGFENSQILKIISMHGIAKVGEVFNFTYNKIREGENIENIGGYIYTVLDRGIINENSSKAIRDNITKEEKDNKSKTKQEAQEKITNYIENEKDPLVKIILLACRQVIPSVILLKAIEEGEMKILKIEERDKIINIKLKYSRYYTGFQDQVLDSIQQAFSKLGKKADISIAPKY